MEIPLVWETGIALWALGLLRSDQIVELAREAIETDKESQSLRKIAFGEDHFGEVKELFLDALDELRVVLPSRPDAARILARAIAVKLLWEGTDPFGAARTLAMVSRFVGPEFHDLDPFIYAESEAEDRPQDREFFAAAIVDEARRWAGT